MTPPGPVGARAQGGVHGNEMRFMVIILLVVGVILALLGVTGRAVGGRRHWF